ncbi:hypothetical protein KC669_01985 [Candidatus Dojkabacteria bacterium]|uniref:Uncharacterized protein n=1 Tax=Candidatus Dojkabacteria bacterium TaxID=2099670 RepID=A0A955LAN9_9BACT|nr:hypothetical protein [Candidatus Dojkabacteria bacterium]
MNKFLKKSLQFGVGIFHVAKDAAEDAIKTLKDEDVFNKEKSKEVVRETVKSTQEQAQKIAESVKNATSSERKESKSADLDVVEEVETGESV